MKRFALVWLVLFGVGLSVVRAQQTVDSLYLNLYDSIQQADTLASSGDLRQALAKYTETQTGLQQFKYSYPDWNPKIVTYRLKYLGERIDDLTRKLVSSVPAASTGGFPTSPTVTTNAASSTPNPAEAELVALRGQLESVRAENTTLVAKLKEALGVQPAPVDAGDLARLQEQVKSLMKENDLLKASLVHGSSESALGKNTSALASVPESLSKENALLKSQLAASRASVTNPAEYEKMDADLKQARLQLAKIQSDVQLKQLENAALENRIRQLESNTNTASTSAPLDQAGSAARISELTQERDNLLARLGDANKQLYGTKKPDMVAQMDQLTDQVRTLRDRLAVAEAQPIPYTTEELALLKQSTPPLTAGELRKRSINEMPPGSAQLVAEAQGFFAAKQYDRAEATYLKLLKQDPNNSLVLGNLAAIEMQEGKLHVAEKHITAAVEKDPNDAFNLATLGNLKFKQGKYDESLDALSRASKLDPRNPEILNYLGVTLAHKGLRPQAEAALRKAIELNPNYAAAHNNLAAIYISQDPPMVELARWHYQKALAAGQPRNPELEKALAEKGSSPATP